MNVIKRFWALLALLTVGTMAVAQDSLHSITVRGYALYDFHYATSGIEGGAAIVDWQVSPTFALQGGIEAANHASPRISANLQGSAVLAGSLQGNHLCLENRYVWRHFPGIGFQEFTGALELAGYLGHANLHLGLCNRYVAELILRHNGGNSTVLEPMNVMFAAEGWLRNQHGVKDWNVGLRWSNYNDFIIERVANWYFSARGFYGLNDRFRITGELGVHPVGSLNLTCMYDGWFAHLGFAYNI